MTTETARTLLISLVWEGRVSAARYLACNQAETQMAVGLPETRGRQRTVGSRVWQDKADFSSSQKCRYAFVCTSFFRETVCLRPGLAKRLMPLSDEGNGRFAPLAREIL